MTEKEETIFYEDMEDIPIGKFEDLGYTMEELSEINPSKMTVTQFREFFNMIIKEGPTLTRETPMRTLKELQAKVTDFLGPSRLESAKQTMKAKRSPKL